VKRVGCIYNTVASGESLVRAHTEARRGKRNKLPCLEFEKRFGKNIRDLHDELVSGAYKPRPYTNFKVYEPKERIIYAPAYRDTVVQHSIYAAINPVFEGVFIDTSFACRIGYGTHKAADYIQSCINTAPAGSYYLQLDIRKYFASIDRGVLRGLVSRKIKDERLVDLMMLFADHIGTTGIPIGNLLSQLFALVYLDPLDHYIKRDLRCKNYARYVDDFLVVGISRQECMITKRRIEDFLADRLGLTLSKSTIQCVDKGINFCGYRMWRGKRLIRKHSLTRYRRAVLSGRDDRATSLLGHAKHTHSLPGMLDYASIHGLRIPSTYQAL